MDESILQYNIPEKRTIHKINTKTIKRYLKIWICPRYFLKSKDEIWIIPDMSVFNSIKKFWEKSKQFCKINM